MSLLYNFGIHLYYLAIRISAWRNEKARALLDGQRSISSSLAKVNGCKDPWVWFHCASLGEFEQGRPIIEAIRREFPQYRLLLTFFSPSGYEARKNEPLADLVTYLPPDTPSHTKEFVCRFNFKMVCFVKGEYWLNMLRSLREQEVPVINAAARFRPQQLFFRPWGGFYRRFLQYFSHILVSNQESLNLLEGIGYENVLQCGDPRFDRMLGLDEESGDHQYLLRFKGKNPLIIFASTWDSDLRLILPLLGCLRQKARIIIAPHEVGGAHITRLQTEISDTTCFSHRNSNDRLSGREILILDTIGDLARIYGYADIAYVGGAFKGTLHNVLEPAAHGVPVLFGQDANNYKFPEASEMIDLGAGKAIPNGIALEKELNTLLDDDEKRTRMGKAALSYISENRGTTTKTLQVMKEYLQ